ncbi:hypothetical protein DSM104299_01128 [Baekduia alba]|nr:hypothetical protein DSM104299_01128 [Baekduia alba]
MVLATTAIAIGALALPGVAAAATCGDLGPAKDYDVFVAGAYTVGNTQIQGRVAVGGDARVAINGGYGVGTALPKNAARVDLVVGGSLTVGSSGAQASNGSVTYGTTLSGTIATPNGTLSHQPPPFSFADSFTDLRALSGQLSGLAANGTWSITPWAALTFTGTSTSRNVFKISAAALQAAQEIAFAVPAGSTVVVNVTGQTYSSATKPTTRISGAPAARLLWNYQLATRVQIGPSIEWQGTVLAPSAAVSFTNGQLHGQVIAASYSGDGTVLHDSPFGGCLPPPPTRDLVLTPLCRNPQSNATNLRLTNTADTAVDVTWSDLDSAQGGALTLPGRTDTYFDVADGETPHRVVVRSSTETAQATTETRACAGRVQVSKVVTGDGTPPDGPWQITLDGDNGYHGAANVNAGQTVGFDVPGDYEAGTVPIGEVVGGFRYTVSEPDPRGAVATISEEPVTILDGMIETVVVGNAYAATEPPPGGGGEGGVGGEGDLTPPPLPGPGGPVVQPPQPTLPPGAPAPVAGPGLIAARSADAADLAVTQVVVPARTQVGGRALSRTTVRNLGTRPAEDVVLREIPQADPKHPNRIVRLVSESADSNVTCSSTRPVICHVGTLAPGAKVTVVARGRMLVAGSYKSVVQASSPTPESNTTNNVGVDGVVVTSRSAPLRVGVRSPAVAVAGQRVTYRVSVRASLHEVSAVQLCHRPARGLLVLSAPGTYQSHGRLCMDISRLRAGHTSAFLVHAVASAQYAGRRVLLPASADSPNRARPARGLSATQIVDVEPSGLG